MGTVIKTDNQERPRSPIKNVEKDEHNQFDKVISEKNVSVESQIRKQLEIFTNLNLIVHSAQLSPVRFGYTFPLYPGEIKCGATDDLSGIFEVKFLTKDDHAYYIRRNWNLRSYDSYLEFAKAYVENIFSIWYEDVFTFLILPPRDNISSVNVYDPNKLGFPLAELLHLPDIYRLDVQAILQSCSNARMLNRHTAHITTAQDAAISTARERLLGVKGTVADDAVYNVLLRLRELDTPFQDAIPFEVPPRPDDFTVLHYVPPFFSSNGVVTSVPFRTYLSANLVMRALSPRIVMEEFKNMTDLASTVGITFSRASSLPELVSLTFSEDMSEDVFAYISTFLNPGAIELDIDFSSYASLSSPVRFFLCCILKCIMYYSLGTHLSTISQTSARSIDKCMASFLVEQGVCIYAPNVNMNDPDLSMLQLVQQRRNSPLTINDLARIVTTPAGAGWFDHGLRVNAQNDEFSAVYIDCPSRPIYLGRDYQDESTFDSYTPNTAAWPLYLSIRNIMSAVFVKQDSKGFVELFNTLLIKFTKLVMRINQYLRAPWYTTMRVRHAEYVRDLTGGSRVNNVMRRTVRVESLIAFLKHVEISEFMLRKEPISVQWTFESQILLEAANIGLASRFFTRVLADFNIRGAAATGDFKRSDFWKWIFSVVRLPGQSSSILEEHFHALHSKEILPSRGIFDLINIATYSDEFRTFGLDLISRPDRFNIADEILYAIDGVRTLSRPQLIDYIDNRRIWFNSEHYLRNENRDFYMGAPIRPWTPNHLRNFLNQIRLNYEMSLRTDGRILGISLPFRYEIAFSASDFSLKPFAIKDESAPVRSIYQSITPATISMQILDFKSVTPNTVLDRLIANLSSVQTIYFRGATIESRVLDSNNFRGKWNDNFKSTMVLRKEGMAFKSLFDLS